MNVKDVLGLFALPFPELVFQAASVHRQHFDPATVQAAPEQAAAAFRAKAPAGHATRLTRRGMEAR